MFFKSLENIVVSLLGAAQRATEDNRNCKPIPDYALFVIFFLGKDNEIEQLRWRKVWLVSEPRGFGHAASDRDYMVFKNSMISLNFHINKFHIISMNNIHRIFSQKRNGIRFFHPFKGIKLLSFVKNAQSEYQRNILEKTSLVFILLVFP